VDKRLPESCDIFKGLSLLNPNFILSQTQKGKFEDLPFLHLAQTNLDLIESQYRKINLVQWCEEDVFKANGIPTETLQFWQGVLQHRSFQELSMYALTCFITPASNAIVERVFSLVTAIKTKPRNRTQTKLLDSIVRIRSYLLDNKICCKDFKCTPQMLSLHNSRTLYISDEQSAKDREDHEVETSYLEEL
jgi:hypothetical protein